MVSKSRVKYSYIIYVSYPRGYFTVHKFAQNSIIFEHFTEWPSECQIISPDIALTFWYKMKHYIGLTIVLLTHFLPINQKKDYYHQFIHPKSFLLFCFVLSCLVLVDPLWPCLILVEYIKIWHNLQKYMILIFPPSHVWHFARVVNRLPC